MNDTLRQFFHCIDEVALAERRKDMRSMWKWLKQAEQFPVENDLQRWTLEYTKAISQLLYDKKADPDALCRRLLALRNKVRLFESPPYVLVKELYLRLLVHLLQKQYTQMEQFPEYEDLARELVERVEDEERYDLDKSDLYAFANGVAGTYYGRRGNILQGEIYYNRVWDRVGNDTVLSPYAFCALTYLINNLWFQGRLDEACEAGVFLWEKLSNGQVIQPFQPDVQRFVAVFCMVLESRGDRDRALDWLQESLDTGLVRDFGQNDDLMTVYALYLGELLFHHRSCSKQMQKMIQKSFQAYQKAEAFAQLTPWRQSNFYLACYNLERLQKGTRPAAWLDACAGVLQNQDFTEADRMPYLTGMSNVIREYREAGRQQQAAECADHLMHRLLQYYSMTEYYEENVRMENYMGICRLGFRIAYMAALDVAEPEKRMEYGLNVKNLLSSVLRLRNRTGQAKWNGNKKDRDVFEWYSLAQLSERIPDDTAVVEFLYAEPETYRSSMLLAEEQKKGHILELFVLAKVNGTECFRHKRIENGRELDQLVEQFFDRLTSAEGKPDRLAGEIYEYLAEPLAEIAGKVKRLWICPDQRLCNLPFDVLFDIVLPDWTDREIVYWKSLRDVFVRWKPEKGREAACVIGNPVFRQKKENTEEQRNSAFSNEEQMVPLPFSAYEAHKIAAMLRGQCYTEQAAVKQQVRSGYRYLHIATHGIRQRDEMNAWYGSGLAFSGIPNKGNSGREAGVGTANPDNAMCENGVLMAEEISRMNLSGTELVTLSACYSGNSRYSGIQEQNGLHIAFGIAGAKYVISALWQVDDLATSIFMFYFYESVVKGETIPAALRAAAFRLRGSTAGQIRTMVEGDRKRMQYDLEEVLEELERMPEDYRVYRSAQYWGSFVCYQNMT